MADPQLQSLLAQGITTTTATAISLVPQGDQVRVLLPGGRQANARAYTDINSSQVNLAITDDAEGIAWCTSAPNPQARQITDLSRGELLERDEFIPGNIKTLLARFVGPSTTDLFVGGNQAEPILLYSNIEANGLSQINLITELTNTGPLSSNWLVTFADSFSDESFIRDVSPQRTYQTGIAFDTFTMANISHERGGFVRSNDGGTIGGQTFNAIGLYRGQIIPGGNDNGPITETQLFPGIVVNLIDLTAQNPRWGNLHTDDEKYSLGFGTVDGVTYVSLLDRAISYREYRYENNDPVFTFFRSSFWNKKIYTVIDDGIPVAGTAIATVAIFKLAGDAIIKEGEVQIPYFASDPSEGFIATRLLYYPSSRELQG